MQPPDWALHPRFQSWLYWGALGANTSPDVLTSLGLSVLVGLSHLRQLSTCLVIRDPAHFPDPLQPARPGGPGEGRWPHRGEAQATGSCYSEAGGVWPPPSQALVPVCPLGLPGPLSRDSACGRSPGPED